MVVFVLQRRSNNFLKKALLYILSGKGGCGKGVSGIKVVREDAGEASAIR